MYLCKIPILYAAPYRVLCKMFDATYVCLQVVDCVVPSTGVIAVGVMQPLTSVSATLTFIKTDMILALEKIVSFRSTVRNQLPKNEALKEFVGRATKHLACAMQKVDKTGVFPRKYLV